MSSKTDNRNSRNEQDYSQRPLALVTGASSGIGRELAISCAKSGFDLLIVADEPRIDQAAQELRKLGVRVDFVQTDLATPEGVDKFIDAIGERPVEALIANAGHGLGGNFVDQSFAQVRHVIDTNITGTVYLVQKIAKQMKEQGRGRILITGSVAGFTPGTYTAVYNGTEAFIDSFSFALRAELKDTGVTVTCLMPGATETEFFDRAGMMDTRVGQSEKDDPADVAKAGFDAMMRGAGDVVSGWRNKLRSTVAAVTPAGVLAEQHRRMAEPGGAQKTEDDSQLSKRSLKAPLIAGGVIAGAGVAYMLLKSGKASTAARNVHVETAILINRTPGDLYSFWRDFTNLPRFMKNLESVSVLDNQRSHWTIKGVTGASIEWDAEIYNEIPTQLISWRSTENADVVNAGTVRFEEARGGRGTNLRITMNYNPPGGVVGTTVTELFGNKIESAIREDLKRFKQLMETGEIATIEGQPSGTAQAQPALKTRTARVGQSESSEGLSRSAAAHGGKS
jgi:short-subunit dehydrogenase/uncharacterized membrane protein